ncbi:hypothetical protein DEI95_07090 [Curtobacterium sp. MCBD17_008]|nr:hypothetical protein DEI95_07090 [Curtobacterium sp. MCBD17_008]
MAGLVLLVAVGVGAVALRSAPDDRTSASTPSPSPSTDGPRMAIGHGFIPDEPTSDATVVPSGAGAGAGAAPSGDTTVVDAATGLPVDDGQASAPWWRRALPIAGDLVPIRGDVRGTVRLEVVGEQVVQITLTGVRVDAGSGATGSHVGAVRVQLSSGDVVGTDRARWTGDDVPADVGSFTPDGEHPVLVIVDPQDLPSVVHSVLLVDAGTGAVLGGAELLPVS